MILNSVSVLLQILVSTANEIIFKHGHVIFVDMDTGQFLKRQLLRHEGYGKIGMTLGSYTNPITVTKDLDNCPSFLVSSCPMSISVFFNLIYMHVVDRVE